MSHPTQQYIGSLQLLLGLKTGGTRSFPRYFFTSSFWMYFKILISIEKIPIYGSLAVFRGCIVTIVDYCPSHTAEN